MPHRLFVLAEAALAPETIEECRALAGEVALAAGEPAALAVLPVSRLRLVEAALLAAGGERFIEEVQPGRRSGTMSSAEFLWREDGRPDWGAMWTGFCELALYGGPPHRGEDNALQAPTAPVATPVDESFDAIAEIRRGIWETTGLYAEPAEPGWLAVICHSRRMAAWLCATVILENVEARFEGERLLLPADPSFALKDQVKSVITVLAKTNHYWQQHVRARSANSAVSS